MTSFAATLGQQIIDRTTQEGRPMDENETVLLFGLSSLEIHDEGVFQQDACQQEIARDGIYQIMTRRLEAFSDARVSIPAAVFLSSLSGGSPGNAVLFATVIAALGEASGREVSLNDIITAFPLRVPAGSTLSAVWDMQKRIEVEGEVVDNGLDQPSVWRPAV